MLNEKNREDMLVADLTGESDIMVEFLRGRFEYAPGQVVRKDDVYASYVAWCKAQRLVPEGKAGFSRELYRVLPLGRMVIRKIDGKRVRCIRGMRAVGASSGEEAAHE